MFTNPLVNAFVMSAEDNDVSFQRKFIGYTLRKLLSVRRHVYDFVIVALGFQLIYHPEHRLDHHHHTGVPAIAIIVHRASGANAVFSDIVDIDFHQSFFPRSSDNRVSQRALQKFRHHRKYIYSH